MSPPAQVQARGHVHATAVALGGGGVLILGPSGSGKSALALALIDSAARAGSFARLVGDDRVALSQAHGRLLARPHPLIAGRIERRGIGITGLSHEPAAVIALAVDLARPAPRMPQPDENVELEGVRLPCLAAGGLSTAALVPLVLARLSGVAPA